MPFDATTFRQPSVRILPPTITGRGSNVGPLPPERGGGPQRIRVEITDRRARPAPRRGRRLMQAWAEYLLAV